MDCKLRIMDKYDTENKWKSQPWIVSDSMVEGVNGVTTSVLEDKCIVFQISLQSPRQDINYRLHILTTKKRGAPYRHPSYGRSFCIAHYNRTSNTETYIDMDMPHIE